jgi:glycosyltransferase involved in cell wall biosynthesis
MTRLWLDLGDLLSFASAFRRPSGIQRVLFELGSALRESEAAAGRTMRFCGCADDDHFAELTWPAVEAVFHCLTTDAPPSRTEPKAPLRVAWRRQRDAATALAAAALAAMPRRRRPAERMLPKSMAPGDVLLIAGAGWAEPGHVRRVGAARREGVAVMLLVHDLIPLRRPEWFTPEEVQRFATWLDGMLDHATGLLAISHATARDLARHLAGRGEAERDVAVIRLGDGFSGPPRQDTAHADIMQRPFVLFVSTIEYRKNHMLLVEVWRRLLLSHDPAAVPLLVFAGREGALSGDMMHQLRASTYLGGHVLVLKDMSDAGIAELYRGCAFTVFPSLYEGWGLPVTESLAAGRPCLASLATSVPEAGGRLARYFDPLDLAGATRMVEAILADPKGLEAWAADIRTGFQPVPWSRTGAEVSAFIWAGARARPGDRDGSP